MKNNYRFAVCILLLLITRQTPTASGQTPPAQGAQQFAALGDLKLQGGGVIQDFRLGYRTLGRLNAEKSNAILWPSWLGGKSADLLQFLGPGKVVDTTNFFVILVDAIGNGVSSSPSNNSKQRLMKFPVFTIRDMVEAEHRLLTEVLHISHLRAVMGISMGGMQTFEWAVAYPRNPLRSTSCCGPRRSMPSNSIPPGITAIPPGHSRADLPFPRRSAR